MITDDASNASMVAAFVAAALIGGISLTLHTLWQLRRIDRDATSFAGTVLTGPWSTWSTWDDDAQSWSEKS